MVRFLFIRTELIGKHFNMKKYLLSIAIIILSVLTISTIVLAVDDIMGSATQTVSGGNLFYLVNGVLYPKVITNNFAIGGTNSSAPFYVDALTGNVNAGNLILSGLFTSPLKISTSSSIDLTWQYDTDTGFDWISDNKISFFTGNTAQLTITANGYVGISSTTPNSLLSLNGSSTLVDLLNFANNSNETLFKIDAYGGVIQNIGITTLKIKASLTDATNISDPWNIYVQGKYAYIAEQSNNKLVIVDIATSTPKIVGVLTDATNLYTTRAIWVAGKYAYMGSNAGNSLTIIDISNPALPAIVSVLIDATNLGDVFDLQVIGKYAYVLGRSINKFTILDISNPYSPVIKGNLTDATNLNSPRGLYVSGKYAYVAGYSGNSLAIVNISNPNTPTITGVITDAVNLNNPYDVHISGRYAYVLNTTGNGLTIIDVSNPASPVIAGVLIDNTNLAGCYGIFSSGNYVYVTSNTNKKVVAVDVSNPARPIIKSVLTDATNFLSVRSIYISGQYAYVLSQGILSIVDLGGMDIPTAVIGNLETNYLSVTDNADFGNDLFIRNGLNIGGSILVNGTSSSPYSHTVIGAYIATSSPIANFYVWGGVTHKTTNINSATYNILSNDYIINNTYTITGISTTTLPTAKNRTGQIFTVKDAGGNSNPNYIRIDGQSGETIDGATYQTIITDYNSISVYSDGSNWYLY